MTLKLSERAATYFRRQRCQSKTLCHADLERFAFDLNKGIFSQIESYLIPGKRSVDIGCGLGIINIFTSRYFDEVYLVDSTVPVGALEHTFYGFFGDGYAVTSDFDPVPSFNSSIHGEYCFYNDLSLSKETVAAHVLEKAVLALEPHQLETLPDGSVDFVQSHMSWGWHFPFRKYAKAVHRLLKTNGLLIVDIREGTTGNEDFVGFRVIDRLPNRETNSKKYVMQKC